ncbi:MAG: hypothetical protein ACKO26_20135, partial [Planctomycetota bacterium]
MRAVPSLILIVAFALPGQSRSPIQLANHPSLSPDGRTVAFDWNGDIWTVPAEGGEARRLTNHPARDTHPVFSTDGKSIAFQSDREGGACVHIMDAGGGDARQVTFKTAGTVPLQFTAGGSKLLVEVTRDHNWKHAHRLALVDISRRAAEDIVFDEAAEAGRISPDCNRILSVLEGTQWWRKGYHGSHAWQVWLHDRAKGTHARLLDNPPVMPGKPVAHHAERGAHSPLWKPDGKSIAFQSDREGGACVHIMDAGGGDARQVTFNTAGTVPLQFTAGGSKLLVEVTRDHNWKHANRLALVDINRRAAEDIVFDEAAEAGRISPDGNRILYVREGTQWWRKGYHGSQAWQVWLHDRAKGTHARLLDNPPV